MGSPVTARPRSRRLVIWPRHFNNDPPTGSRRHIHPSLLPPPSAAPPPHPLCCQSSFVALRLLHGYRVSHSTPPPPHLCVPLPTPNRHLSSPLVHSCSRGGWNDRGGLNLPWSQKKMSTGLRDDPCSCSRCWTGTGRPMWTPPV